MTTRKHPSDPEEMDAHIALYEGKIAELESALAEAKDKHLRLAADFDNYKKRMRQEQLDTMKHASTELIHRLLPVLDDLQNVLEHRPKHVDELWLKEARGGTRHPRPRADRVGGGAFRSEAARGGRARGVRRPSRGHCRLGAAPRLSRPRPGRAPGAGEGVAASRGAAGRELILRR
jgi:hypothetical protein